MNKTEKKYICAGCCEYVDKVTFDEDKDNDFCEDCTKPVDLFETPEKIPQKVNKILDKYREGDYTYTDCARLQSELQKVGFTIDYYLDAIPYNLREVAPINEFEQIIHSK
jgi:hypothetical protein